MRRTWAGSVLLAIALAFAGAPGVSAQDAAFETLVLSPSPGERVAQGDVGIAVSFFDPAGRLDPSSIQIRLNNRDITPEAMVSPELVTWRPPIGIPPGLQRVVVTARDRTGQPLPPVSWTFTVTGDRAATEEGGRRPLPQWTQAQGSVIFEGRTASVSGPGADFRRDDTSVPLFWLNLAGTIVPGWRYSTRIHASGYESSDRQAVNRYRFDVRSNNLNLTLGDANPALQSLILSGQRVRGLTAEARSRFGNLTVVAGQSRRAVEGRLNPLDPAQIQQMGTHQRDLFAVRPSFGSGETFQAGFTFLRVRDDVNSLSALRTEPGDATLGSRSVNPHPKDNLVAGADLSARFFDGRLHLQYDNAFSLYANDISGGPISKTQLDSIMEAQGYEPLDINPGDYERWFILNASTIPLDPREMSSLSQQVRATIRGGAHVISAEWRSIGGSYYSLGNPAMQRDRAGFRVRDSFLMFDNSLAVSAGFERDEDNLDNIKTATTTSSGVFLDLNWQASPTSFGLNAAFRSGARSNDLAVGEQDARDESNRTISAGMSIPFGLREGLTTRFNLSGALVTRDDDANPTAGSKNTFILGGIQGETAGRGSEFSAMYGLSRSELTGFDNASTDFHRIMGDLRHRLSERWTGTFNASLTSAVSPENAGEFGLDYSRREFTGGAEWRWMEGSAVNFQTGVVSYTDDRQADRDTREIIARLRVVRAF